MTEDEFVNRVMEHMIAEHGRDRTKLAYLEPRIRIAHGTESGISADELSDLFHGSEEGGVPDTLQAQYPLLNAVALSPYTELEEEEEEDEEEDDEDDDDDNEEEDDDD